MIYENIKKFCKENNISICSLEKELGLSNGSIREWNKSIPSADRLKKVADRFNVLMDDLFKD